MWRLINSSTFVDLLLQARADVNSRNGDGETALINAIEWGNDSCVCLLLIQAKADVNMIYQNDEMALMQALIRGYTECVDLLIYAAAHVNIESRTGETALLYALTGRKHTPAAMRKRIHEF